MKQPLMCVRHMIHREGRASSWRDYMMHQTSSKAEIVTGEASFQLERLRSCLRPRFAGQAQAFLSTAKVRARPLSSRRFEAQLRWESSEGTKGMVSMTNKLAIYSALMIAIVCGTAGVRSFQGRGTSSHTVTQEQYAQWKKDLSNWGRWGKDDEIGTMNLITPAKRKQAAALVREGFSVSLAGDPDEVKAVDN